MALIRPTISWQANISKTSPHTTQYNYSCKVIKINANDPGYGELVVGYYIVDFIGHIFEIKEINYGGDSTTVRVEDLLQDPYSYGPYSGKIAYVYGSLQEAATIAQAKLNRLDESAEDFVRSLGLNPKLLEVDYIDFNTTLDPNPDNLEGRLFYDKDKNALSYYNDAADITVNLAQEFLIPIHNDTGNEIPNGAMVYPTGVFGDKHTVGLADASKTNKCRLVAMATHAIPDGENGYATRLGSVGGLNTIGMTGVVFLSATDPGEYTMTIPDDGAYIIPIGAIKEIHATEGSITVDPNISELTVEVTDTNGFPTDQRSNSTFSFNNSNRTFTITPVVAPFHYYDEGIKYEIDAADDVIIDDIEGECLIYYDNDVLSFISTPSTSEIDIVIRTQCLVAYLYWDKVNQEAIYFGDERHGISMAPSTHSYLHFTRGAQFLYGLGLSDILADQNGSLNAHAQFSVGQGLMIDEDLPTYVSNIASTVGLPIYYLDGINGELRLTSNPGFAIRTYDNTSTTRLAYNEWTGSTWQISEVGNNNFALYHVFTINAYASDKRMISIMGQEQYANKIVAREGANTEISNLLISLPFPEMVPIGTVIYQTGSYANDVNSKIITTDAGEDYIDWRTSELAQGSSPTDHGNLTGLTDDDHLQYALLNGRTGDILHIDQIDEFTVDTGVTIESTLFKDSYISQSEIDIKLGEVDFIKNNEILHNFKIGTSSLNSITTGNNIIAIGHQAANLIDTSTDSVFLGYKAGYNSTSNISQYIGSNAGVGTTGNYNTGNGFNTLLNSTGSHIVAIGRYAGSNTTGSYTTAIGNNSYKYSPADRSIFIGYLSGNNANIGKTTTKDYITAIGYGSAANIDAYISTFIGTSSGDSGAGYYATFIGEYSGMSYIGNYNTGIGYRSGDIVNGDYNTLIGRYSGRLLIGDRNLCIGNEAGYNSTGSDNMYFGYQTGSGLTESNILRIGNLIKGDFSTGIVEIDIINEYTTDNGINIETINLKDGSITIPGDLTVNGTTFTANTETVLIEDNMLVVNYGETGGGVTAGVGGIRVDRGTADDYMFVFDEVRDLFVIGVGADETAITVATFQAVATREDSPTDNYYAKWDTATTKFETVSADTIVSESTDSRLFFDRDPNAHVLNSSDHTISGQTPGYFLKVLTATTFGFAAHGLTYSDVGAEQAFTKNTAFNKDFGTLGTEVCVGNDSRLSDNRIPTAHAMDSATYHTSSDITILNATTSKHGFLPKLGGGTSNFLRADGTWVTPPGTSPMVYPNVGIALSTGTSWGTSITNNSSNWNTAYTHSQITTGNPHNLNLTDIGESYADINYWIQSGSDIYYNGGNVGIGHSIPTELLHIYKWQDDVKIRLAGSANNWYLENIYADKKFRISDNGGNKLTIDDTGNVGIGTTLVDTLLHLEGSDPVITLESTEAYSTIPSVEINSRFKYNTGGSVTNFGKIVFSKDNATDADTGGFTAFYKKPAGLAASEAMRIDPDGNVGIGTTNPISNFHIQADNPQMIFYDSGEGAGDKIIRIQYRSESLYFDSRNDLNTVGDVSNILVLNRSGNVGIGTDNPIKKLHVHEVDIAQSFGSGVFEFTATSNFGSVKSILSHRQDVNQIVVNEDATDTDFRVEGTTDGNLIFANAGTNMVGIGDNTPSYKLDVNGTGRFTGVLYANSSIVQGDNISHYWGTNNDGRIYHNNSDWYFRSYKHGGRILLQGENTAGTNRALIYADPDGAVNLYYAGSGRLNTTTAGIDVLGTITASSTITAPTIKLSTNAISGYTWQCTNVDGSGAWANVTGSVYKGEVNGSTGIPISGGSALIDGTGTSGWYYACSVVGTYDYGNPSGNSITLAIGDQIYYNGSIWLKIPGSGSYTLPVATTTTLGGIKIGYTNTGANLAVALSSEKAYIALTNSAIKNVFISGTDYEVPLTFNTGLTRSTNTITNTDRGSTAVSSHESTYNHTNYNTAYGWGDHSGLYVGLTGNETVAGIKTFSSFPLTPSSDPSNNYDVANKKYVDDQISGGTGGYWTQSGNDIYYSTGKVSIVSTMYSGNSLIFDNSLNSTFSIYYTGPQSDLLRLGGSTTNRGIVWQSSTINAGINTDSPAYTLDVNGTLRVETHLYVGATPDLDIYQSTGSYIVNRQHGTAMYIQSEDGSGNLKTLIYGHASGKTALYYTGNNKLETTNTGISVTGAIVASTTITASSTMTATNFILSSDIRLKENIELIKPSTIDNIELKQFNFKSDETKRLRYGVIAQELEKTHPEMVHEDGEGFKQVDYTDFLLAKIASLENRLNKLEG